MIQLENSMKAMKDSQEAMEHSTIICQEKILRMKTSNEDSMALMSDMITKMGDSITSQNQQLEIQAKAQVKQAEDIQTMMAAIKAIGEAVQATPPTNREDNSMQIDIPESNQNKRKQTSLESTTLLTDDTLESIMTQPTAAEAQYKGVHNAEQQ